MVESGVKDRKIWFLHQAPLPNTQKEEKSHYDVAPSSFWHKTTWQAKYFKSLEKYHNS